MSELRDGERRSRRVDFERVNAAARRNCEAVVTGLLPEGRREGREWVARNPNRADRRLGSFKANLDTGKWGDFSSGDHGGDLVSLAAYVSGLPQREAAIRRRRAWGYPHGPEALRSRSRSPGRTQLRQHDHDIGGRVFPYPRPV